MQSAGNAGCDFTPNNEASHKAGDQRWRGQRNDQREWQYSNYGSQLDIVAPVVVLTTDIQGDDGYGDWNDPDYRNGYNGTSAAAPLVAGTMAPAFAANERLTAKRARKILVRTTATRMDPEGGQYDETGWSPWYDADVDAGAAVAAVADAERRRFASPVILSHNLRQPPTESSPMGRRGRPRRTKRASTG